MRASSLWASRRLARAACPRHAAATACGGFMHHFDLVILGCGPAGEKAAAQAAYFGKKVAIIDRATPGGACVHTGTLPSKGLRESALAMVALRNLGLRGVKCTLAEDVRVDELLARKETVVQAEVERIYKNLERHHIEFFRGRGEFVDAHTIRVQPDNDIAVDLHGDVIVIATGTSPHRPTDIPFDEDAVWDSDEVLQMSSVPKSLAVYGAGVIGCEYAAMFGALGVDVHLLEPRDKILPFVDRDISDALLGAFRNDGIHIQTNARYSSCKVVDGMVDLGLSDGTTLRTQCFLYAAGRNGNTVGLGLEAAGVKVNKRGLVEVDERFETAVPGVYAVGDVIGFPALASTSMDQGRVAVCHAFGFTYKRGLSRFLPYGIYTIPECAMVGPTEQELEDKNEPYEVGRANFAENARAQLVGATEGMLKLIFRPDDKKLLAVHCVGERASELVHVGMTVMQMDGSIDVFIDAVYNYPTLGELFKYAAYNGLQRLARRKAFETGPVDAGHV
ncbi:MAG: Si-specific NAD(P)(+) transhydrogenase [Myxococcales bacterium]|nr:Si-specific NAD(P)(+) transhydrogenase [Myxococcales bacterium]